MCARPVYARDEENPASIDTGTHQTRPAATRRDMKTMHTPEKEQDLPPNHTNTKSLFSPTRPSHQTILRPDTRCRCNSKRCSDTHAFRVFPERFCQTLQQHHLFFHCIGSAILCRSNRQCNNMGRNTFEGNTFTGTM